jgi:hypothetical protein
MCNVRIYDHRAEEQVATMSRNHHNSYSYTVSTYSNDHPMIIRITSLNTSDGLVM